MTSVERSVVQTFAQPAVDKTVLRVADLTTGFRQDRSTVDVVRGVSFELKAGRTLVLLGESGCGKSVTARSVMRLHPDRAVISGSIALGDQELLTLSPRSMVQLRGQQIALVPQDPAGALSPLRKIGSQLSEVLRVHEVVSGRQARAERGLDLLSRVGISDPRRVAHAYAHELSGGMRQRVAIAIAIACDPAVLIADEPTTALDVTVQAQILDLFEDLQDRLGMATLLVTHDVGVAERMADEIAVMYAGRIVETGPAETVLGSPRHPYTAALLRALPAPGVARGELIPISGQPSAPAERPSGCPFRTRCSFVHDACSTYEPALLHTDVETYAACDLVHPQERVAS
ncbi:MAG: transporter ATP-binding protein [Frankiales bacterium]|nr:transporter ATP-binding protein [Frankiales bacterium]